MESIHIVSASNDSLLSDTLNDKEIDDSLLSRKSIALLNASLNISRRNSRQIQENKSLHLETTGHDAQHHQTHVEKVRKAILPTTHVTITDMIEMNGEELSKEEYQFYLEAFKLFDKDNSGSIDREELSQVMIQIGLAATGEQLELMINNIDFNLTGQVDFDEFLAVMEATQKSKRKRAEMVLGQSEKTTTESFMDFDPNSDESIAESFRVMDLNGDGVIDVNDLRRVMIGLQMDVDPEKILEMVADVDKDGTGSVCFKDFSVMMRSSDGYQKVK